MKNKKRKKFVLLLIIFSLLLIFSGCNNSKSIDLESQLSNSEIEEDEKEDTVEQNIKENEKISESKENKKEKDEIIVEVVDKQNKPADIENWEYQDWVGFSISITNNTSKTIKGIQGILDIQDVFGESILKLNYDLLGEKIEPSKTIINDDMGIYVNPYISEHTKIYKLSYDDLKFNYIIEKIAFEDGTILEF